MCCVLFWFLVNGYCRRSVHVFSSDVYFFGRRLSNTKNMNVILHGEGEEIRMHQCSTDVLQHRITVPVKVFLGTKNKWETPVILDKEMIYKFTYQDGNYYHYKLENHQKN